MSNQVVVIGAGFSGLSAASFLRQKGFEVTVVEKHSTPGGRARKFQASGFTFDMGPSWYWMPDVFERYFSCFGKKPSDYYDLIRLDPSYTVFFGESEVVEVPASFTELEKLFEKYEPGSTENLNKFLKEAKYKYETGMKEFVFKPGESVFEFVDWKVIKSLPRIQLLNSLSSHVRRLFKNEKLIQLLEFPVLFLGATPQNTPAMYSLMNYADMSLGTWYPQGGMFRVVEGMVSLAKEIGVKFEFGQEVTGINVKGGVAREVVTKKQTYKADVVVAAADYNHVEQQLLEPSCRTYSPTYWEKRTMAPSSLLFFLGVNKKIDSLWHHNLFFDADFSKHAVEIYDNPQWPTKPLFYVCCTSKTDPHSAPPGCENLFVLLPLAPGLEDSETQREFYYNEIMDRMESLLGQSIRENIVYKKSYAISDFKVDYNAFKGNAYGLANTLRQTAFLKPKMKSKKVKNLFFAGQLTTPGPGVPPSLISGEVVAGEVWKKFKPVMNKIVEPPTQKK